MVAALDGRGRDGAPRTCTETGDRCWGDQSGGGTDTNRSPSSKCSPGGVAGPETSAGGAGVAIVALFAVLLLTVTPASASASWYLIAPPCAPTHVVTLNNGSKTLEPATCAPDDRTPLSKWESIGSFNTAETCDAQKLAVTTLRNCSYLQELDRTNNPADPTVITLKREYDQMSHARCVASEDPRLK